MELRVLRYFVESARENSMTRAAEKLHVTQPTLSRQLRDLERELGQKLFVRSNGDTVLQNRGILSDRELRCIQQFIKENYREMYLKWSRLSEEGFYQND